MTAALGARGSSSTCKWAERERNLSYYVAWPWTPQAGQVAPPWLGVAARCVRSCSLAAHAYTPPSSIA